VGESGFNFITGMGPRKSSFSNAQQQLCEQLVSADVLPPAQLRHRAFQLAGIVLLFGGLGLGFDQL